MTTGTPAILAHRFPQRRGFGEAVPDGGFQAAYRSGLPAGEEFEALGPDRNCRWLGQDQAWSNFGAVRSSRGRRRGGCTLGLFIFDAKTAASRRNRAR